MIHDYLDAYELLDDVYQEFFLSRHTTGTIHIINAKKYILDRVAEISRDIILPGNVCKI